MTGLDKIINQIQNESKEKINEIISAAEKKAKEIVSAANEDAQSKANEIVEKAEKDTKIILSRAESANAIEIKNSILLKKQDIIKKAVANTQNYICELPDSEYFDIILKMVKKYAPKKSGDVQFNKADLARLPKDFEAAMNTALNDSSVSLKISDKPADINGGFILCYGGVEENCSFKALFESAADELSDKAHTLLFS